MSDVLIEQAVPSGAYAERLDPPGSRLDRFAERIASPLVRWARLRPARGERLLALAEVHGREVARLDDGELREAAVALRVPLRAEGFTDDLVARAFALVREAATRRIGQRHFDVQLQGGRVLLAGMVAEMETGEGKTLTATLPACTAALAGVPVHVITVNDYLATRDAGWMKPVYEALGLTVGVVAHGLDGEARRAAYACDVTYCTNKEIAFDYLRDRIVLGREHGRVRLQIERLWDPQARARRLVLRGLHFGLVDEADSVLIDEARTPLIISGRSDSAPEQPTYEAALALAGRLEAGRDYAIDGFDRQVRITEAGEAHLADLARPLGGVWAMGLHRRELIRQALTAQHLFHRDRHYLVQEGRVQIVDEFTGRLMPDRSWEQGLHQLIEVKEGCALTGRNETLARISYQRFFRRYRRLAGMTGTAREVAGELWSVYRLPVARIATNRPLARRAAPDRVFLTATPRWQAVVDQVAARHREGRPVLVGTRSVAASEHLSALLTAAELPHRVLNARQDLEEAETVALAGEGGRITVATNMAGRGTDIRLGNGVAALGGLHVIATERHESGRIDRQLFGRCGRQGDPGTHEAIVSLEDELVSVHAARWGRLARRFSGPGGEVPAWMARLVFGRAQARAQRAHARARRDLMRSDEQLQTMLAFSGRIE